MDGAPVGLGAPKQRALLATLLLRRNEVVSRDRLVAALWGEAPPASAAAALQVYVHGLRRALGAGRIETHGSGYRIGVEPGELDLDRFEQLFERARRALADSQPADADEDLRAALAFWAGPPLADLAGEEPLEAEAARLEDLRLRAIELRNDAELALARHDGLAARLELLIAEQPFRERFREQHMLALYRSGRQKEALDAYRSARRTLVDELGVEPGPALQELERAILRQDPSLAAPPAHQRNAGRLPAVPTPLIGRDLEVAAVTALLMRDDVRQVTLTGPGGSGKTRLALAVAGELAPRLRDGVVFIDLSRVADAALLVPTIGQALGVQDREQPLEVAIAEDLRGRAGLLVLDNFEQLLPSAVRVAELLADAPRLLVLVTSRAPLRLSWEHEYPVPPLSPPDERSAGFTELAGNDAVRLFAARAGAVDPGFELTERAAEAVAAICRRLDGLPLAIELAAARSKLLPPEAMVQQLGQALPLLTGGAVDLPERHQTLQATLDWSYALLAASERSLLARLAVFAGGCTSHDATVIRGELGDDPLPILGALVDHSLLRRVDGPDDQPRFIMLETIREYALGHLEASGDEDTLRLLHAEHFVTLAENTERDIFAGTDPAPLLRQLESEHDNLRAALGYLHEQGAGELELRLASSLAYFWRVRGYLGEGRMWLESALASGSDVPPVLRAKSLSNAGRLAYRQGDYGHARELQEQALAISRAAGELRAVGQALSDLGGLSNAEGDRDRAEALFWESAEVLRRADHRVRLATVLGNLANIRLGRGDTEGARPLADEALALQKETGDKEGRAFTYLLLGRIATHDEGGEEAAEAFRQSLALIHELDYREIHGYWFLSCAELAWKQGDALRAARLVGAADADFERVGISQLQDEDLQVRANLIEAVLAKVGSEALHAALAEGRETSDEDALRP